jgi:predicted glycoside hydrolase/deacetylase ChbG (UPF0249 family)
MLTSKLTTMCLLVLSGSMLTALKTVAAEPTYAERLGWPPGSRVVIFHVDDVGMSHDSNVGAIKAVTDGVATSMSIMFPCPWVSEIGKYVKEHPTVDAGIHVTLTSEWPRYRWGPLAGKKTVPSLIDPEGCLWPDVASMTTAKPEEVEAEIRAQLDRCRTMGIEPTHLDSHMGSVFANPLFTQKYMQIGIEAKIPVMLPGGHMQHIAKSMPSMVTAARQAAKLLWDAGLPVLDDLHMGGGANKPEEKKALIINFLRTLKPGVTQFIVHCTQPGDTFQYISSSGPMRLAELEAMIAPDVKKVIEDEKIILTTWRELKQRRDKVK